MTGATVDGYRYREMAPACPSCFDRMSAIETTGDLGRYRYVCWCGAWCELLATGDELAALGVPRETIAALERGDLR